MFIDKLDGIVNKYNSIYHGTMKMKIQNQVHILTSTLIWVEGGGGSFSPMLVFP